MLTPRPKWKIHLLGPVFAREIGPEDVLEDAVKHVAKLTPSQKKLLGYLACQWLMEDTEGWISEISLASGIGVALQTIRNDISSLRREFSKDCVEGDTDRRLVKELFEIDVLSYLPAKKWSLLSAEAAVTILNLSDETQLMMGFRQTNASTAKPDCPWIVEAAAKIKELREAVSSHLLTLQMSTNIELPSPTHVDEITTPSSIIGEISASEAASPSVFSGEGRYEYASREEKTDAGIYVPPDAQKGSVIDLPTRLSSTTTACVHFPNLDTIRRQPYLDQIQNLFTEKSVVVLWGEGGIGKTAIAISYCQEFHKECHRAPILWIDCDEYKTAEQGLQRAYWQLWGTGWESWHTARKRFQRAFHEAAVQNAPCLVVLDNFESGEFSLLEEIRDLGCQVLITSQKAVPSHATIRIEPLNGMDGQELFRQRREHLAEHELETVQEICRLVGHLPLAIELAAASPLPLKIVAKKFQESFAVLSSSASSDRRPKHMSIEKCFDVSFRGLSTGAQSLLTHLALLPYGWSYEVMEEILTELALDLETVQELADRCFFRLSGERYSSHSLIRRFATEKIAEDARKSAEDVLGAALATVARRKGVDARPGPTQGKALQWFETEWANLTHCLSENFGTPAHFDKRDFTDSLGDVILMKARWDDCERMLHYALTRRLESGDKVAVARSFINLADVIERQADQYIGLKQHNKAIHKSQHTLKLVEEARKCLGRDNSLEALEVRGLACHIAGRGRLDLQEWQKSLEDFRQSQHFFRAAAEVSEPTQKPKFLVYFIRSINYQGRSYEMQEKWTKAIQCYTEALSLCVEHNIRIGLGRVKGNLGFVALKQGDTGEAFSLFEEALSIAQDPDVGDEHNRLRMLQGLARVYLHKKEWQTARDFANQSLSGLRDIQDYGMAAEVSELLDQIEKSQAAMNAPLILQASNLPTPRPYLGRDMELECVKRLLEKNNIVLIHGLGGMGKSSMALRLAADWKKPQRDAFCYWINAENATGYDEVLRTLWRHMLGLTGEFPTAMMENQIIEASAGRPCCIVLDSLFDRHPDPNPEEELYLFNRLFDRLDNQCLGIVTRRVPWSDWIGEIYQLQELETPEAAVAIFERYHTRPISSNNDKDLVKELCRRACYLPLAIELIARGSEPLSYIAEKLDLLYEGEHFLPGSSEDRSLMACFRIGYDLLTDEQRDFYISLLMLNEGPTEEMANVVANQGKREQWQKHANCIEERGLWQWDGTRYRIHSLVREVASRLFCGELLLLTDRLAAQLQSSIKRKRVFVDKNRSEINRALKLWFNLKRSTENDFDDGGTFRRDEFFEDDPIAYILFTTGPWETYKPFFENLSQMSAVLEESLWLAESLTALAEIEMYRGAAIRDFAAAKTYAERRLVMASSAETAEMETRAFTHRTLGHVHIVQEEWECAEQALARSFDCWKNCYERSEERKWSVVVGYVRAFSQRARIRNRRALLAPDELHSRILSGEALSFHNQALALCKTNGLKIGECRILAHMGQIYSERGEDDQAKQILREALLISRTLGVGDTYCEGRILMKLARIGGFGSPEESLEAIKTAENIFVAAGDKLLYIECRKMRVERS